MTDWNPLNRAQAKALFDSSACLIGDRDAIPQRKAREMLGADAIDFVLRMDAASSRPNSPRLVSGYGIGDYTAYYLTEYGFYAAVTFRNISEIRKQAHIDR